MNPTAQNSAAKAPQGFPPVHQKQVGAHDSTDILAELKTPGSLPDLGHKATRRAKGIFSEMAKHLPDAISALRFPRVVFDASAQNSSFDLHNNQIVIAKQDVANGYAYAEEISHWVRDSLSPGGDKARTHLSAALGERSVRAVDEFFGFVGRAFAAEACRGTQWEGLFKADSASIPASYESMARSAKLHRESGYQRLSAVESFEEIVSATQVNLEALAQHQWLKSSASDGDCLSLEAFVGAAREAREELRSALPSTGHKTGQDEFRKLLSALLEMISAVSNNALQHTSQPAAISNARHVCCKMVAGALRQVSLIGDDLHMRRLMALADATDFKGHGAGYSSAALTLEREGTPTEIFGRLITADVGHVFCKYIVCDSCGEQKGQLGRLWERVRLLFGRGDAA